jgi:hypothetical protein
MIDFVLIFVGISLDDERAGSLNRLYELNHY